MAIRITCPACETNNTIDDDLRGRKIRCRKCDEVIRVPAESNDEEEQRSANKRNRKPVKQGFPIVLAAIIGGAGVLVVLLLVVASVAAFLLLRSKPSASSIQQSLNDQKPVEGVVNNPAAPDHRPNPDANPKSRSPSVPAVPFVNPPLVPADLAELGEKVLPAGQAPGDAPLRPFQGIAIYKLSDVRLSGRLMIHYERLSGEDRDGGPDLVLRTPDGNESIVRGSSAIFNGTKKAGDVVVGSGFGAKKGVGLKVLEAYLVYHDQRWQDEGFRPKFKVSNSVVVGEMGRPLQYAREWKPDETAKLSNPPPEAPPANAHLNVGEDTQFVGNMMNPPPSRRFADPAKRPVIGVFFQTGQWDNVKCLTSLVPVYDVRQPRHALQASLAKPGYAVGGLNVKTKKLVTAVQVVFMKLKVDGTLDPADQYTSNWLGSPEEAEGQGTIGGNGRKVIGMSIKSGAAVDAVALVLD